jgi:hypothetical protein
VGLPAAPNSAQARGPDRAGSLDRTSGTGGRVTTDFAGDHDQANALAVQSDGRLAAAGHAQTGGTPDFALARYRNN